VLPNNADGTFGTAINLGTDTGPDHVIAVDLDANGSQELVTTNEAGDSISVFINQNHSAFTDLDHALAGFNGLPFLEGVGTLKADTTAALRLSNARNNAQAFLVFGATRIDAPFAGGIFVPFPDVILPVVTDSTGGLFLQGTWPSGVNPGEDFFFQFWILDSSGPNNFSASNALQATAQ